MQSYIQNEFSATVKPSPFSVLLVGKTVGGLLSKKAMQRPSGWLTFGNFPCEIYEGVEEVEFLTFATPLTIYNSHYCQNLNFYV